VDFETNGGISDDELMSRLIMRLPAGCEVFCLFDCCHSGTCLDLPYKIKFTGRRSSDIHVNLQSAVTTEENPNFNFSKLLDHAKSIIDSIDDAVETGLANLAQFIGGFKNVFPI